MIRKLRNFCDNIFTTKTVTFIAAIIFFTIALFIGVTKFETVREFIIYPEEEYCLLEAEAERLINNNSFETEYSYEIVASNNENKKHIEMKISTNFANVKINFENFGTPEELVSVERMLDTPTKYVIAGIIVLLSACALCTLVIESALYILMFIFACIIWLIDKIVPKKVIK